MNPSLDLRTPVRRELSLEARNWRQRRTSVLRLAAATAFLCTLGTGAALAQAPYQQEVIPGFSSLVVGSFESAPALGDLDGDGDLDVVVGERYGSLAFFQNTGTASLPAFAGKVGSANPFSGINVLNTSTPELVDVDGDGDLDVVVGDLFGSLRYFENTGSSIAAGFAERTGSANPFVVLTGSGSGFSLVDLDADGDIDCIMGEAFGLIRYFENTGSASATAFVERTGSANPLGLVGVLRRASPDLVDLDGDGDLDAVVGGFPPRLEYFRNSGSSADPAFVWETGAANPFAGIEVARYLKPDLADLDGDGDLDSVVGVPAGGLEYLLNTGGPSVPAFVEDTGSSNPFAGVDLGYLSSPELVDLDGDGDLDVVVGENFGHLRYFQNLGTTSSPSFEERTENSNPFGGIHVGALSSPELVDLDGDGDLDLAVGERYGSIRYFQNLGSSSVPILILIEGAANPFNGFDVGTNNSLKLVDTDADGDFDAVIGERYGSLQFLENTGSSSAPAFVERSASPLDGIDVGDSSSPELVDLDSDADLDLVVGERSGRVCYFENTGSAAVPAFMGRTGTANPFEAVAVVNSSSPDLADLDGDGDLDVLSGQGGGKIVFFRSLANDLFADGFESGDTSAWTMTVP